MFAGLVVLAVIAIIALSTTRDGVRPLAQQPRHDEPPEVLANPTPASDDSAGPTPVRSEVTSNMPPWPPTSSAPALTLEGHLRKRVQRKPLDKVATVASAANLTADREYNRENKIPTVEQEAELQQIANEYNTKMLEVMRIERSLADAACLTAIDKGQVETWSMLVPGPTRSREQNERQNTNLVQEAIARLSARLGKELESWACRHVTTYEPDGVSRYNLIWFTRDQTPGLFENRSRIPAAQTELRQRARAVFDGM